MSRQINDAGLKTIIEFEGLELRAYRDAAGILTIGYGHTGPDVQEKQVITKERAVELLKEDLNYWQKTVGYHFPNLLDNQFSALVSLCYNVGSLPLIMTLGKKLRAGDIQGAANEFLRWNRAGGKVLEGLRRRRRAERELFLKA